MNLIVNLPRALLLPTIPFALIAEAFLRQMVKSERPV